MGDFYVVATPIGNLEDITLRAISVLKSADLILAEDTRITLKLLNRYQIKTSLKRYNEDNPGPAIKAAAEILGRGGSVALVSDAGTPGISDPGFMIINWLRQNLPDEVRVVPVPGPAAVTALVSVSGEPGRRFAFLGYPPAKKKRKKFFELIANSPVWPVVIYESPHRLLKTLADIKSTLGKDCQLVLGRELTKVFEEIIWGKVDEIEADFKARGKIKGEFVLLIKEPENYDG